MKMYVGMLLVSLLLASCLSHEGMVQEVIGYDARAQKNGAEVIFSNVHFVPLQEQKYAIADFPNKVKVKGDNVFVKTGNQLLRFSRNGQFCNKIGIRGHGRGEYINLSAFYLESTQTAVLIDSYKGRLMRYGVDGTYLDEIKVGDFLQRANDAYLLNEDSLFVSNYITGNKNDVYDILNLKTNEMSVVAQTKLSTIMSLFQSEEIVSL